MVIDCVEKLKEVIVFCAKEIVIVVVFERSFMVVVWVCLLESIRKTVDYV